MPAIGQRNLEKHLGDQMGFPLGFPLEDRISFLLSITSYRHSNCSSEMLWLREETK
jgi:hypothetical protein